MYGEKDYSTREGCIELVDTIKLYWAQRGMYPFVEAVRNYSVASPKDETRCTWEVRSNIVGGYPRG